METQFNPYHKWLGVPLQEQPANHYRLLGVALFECDPEVIESAADRQMAFVQSFQSGRYSEHSQTVLNELSAAKVCLLKPAPKAEYDRKLRAEIAAANSLAPPVAPPTQTPLQPSTAPLVPSAPAGGPSIPVVRGPHSVPAAMNPPWPARVQPGARSARQNHDPAARRTRRRALLVAVPIVAALGLVLSGVVGRMLSSPSTPGEENQLAAKDRVENALPNPEPARAIVPAVALPEPIAPPIDFKPPAEFKPSDEAKPPVEPMEIKSPAENKPAAEPAPPPKPAAPEPPAKPVEPVPPNVVAANDPPQQPVAPAAEKPPIKLFPGPPDVRALQWIISVGGRATVRLPNNRVKYVGKPNEIPNPPFVVEQISLSPGKPVEADGFANLQGMLFLQRIDLQSDAVTDDGLQHLTSLNSLQCININSSLVTDAGLLHLQAMKGLSELSLHRTQISDQGLLSLRPLVNLRTFSINHARITDAGLDNLLPQEMLEELTLHHVPITNEGMKYVARLPKLRSLNLSSTKVTSIEELRPLNELQFLSQGNKEFDDAGLQCVGEFPNLIHLSLGGCSISDPTMERLAGLKKLTHLLIQSTLVTDAGIEKLQEVNSLRVLYPGSPDTRRKFTNEALEKLLKVLPKCRLDGPR